MIWLWRALLGLAALAGLTVVAGQAGLLQGRAPADLGVRNGRLKPPSDTPNSVSSQAGLWTGNPQRAGAQIEPLPLQGDGPASMARLRALVAAMPGVRIVESRPDYLYAQFTTRVLRFVDDTEFWFDPAAGVIVLRSASRIGRRDCEVNRQRIEAIRASYASGT